MRQLDIYLRYFVNNYSLIQLNQHFKGLMGSGSQDPKPLLIALNGIEMELDRQHAAAPLTWQETMTSVINHVATKFWRSKEFIFSPTRANRWVFSFTTIESNQSVTRDAEWNKIPYPKGKNLSELTMPTTIKKYAT